MHTVVTEHTYVCVSVCARMYTYVVLCVLGIHTYVCVGIIAIPVDSVCELFTMKALGSTR